MKKKIPPYIKAMQNGALGEIRTKAFLMEREVATFDLWHPRHGNAGCIGHLHCKLEKNPEIDLKRRNITSKIA